MAAFSERVGHSVDHIFSLYFDYCNCNSSYFPFGFLGHDLGSECSSSWSLHTCYF